MWAGYVRGVKSGGGFCFFVFWGVVGVTVVASAGFGEDAVGGCDFSGVLVLVSPEFSILSVPHEFGPS